MTIEEKREQIRECTSGRDNDPCYVCERLRKEIEEYEAAARVPEAGDYIERWRFNWLLDRERDLRQGAEAQAAHFLAQRIAAESERDTYKKAFAETVGTLAEVRAERDALKGVKADFIVVDEI